MIYELKHRSKTLTQSVTPGSPWPCPDTGDAGWRMRICAWTGRTDTWTDSSQPGASTRPHGARTYTVVRRGFAEGPDVFYTQTVSRVVKSEVIRDTVPYSYRYSCAYTVHREPHSSLQRARALNAQPASPALARTMLFRLFIRSPPVPAALRASATRKGEAPVSAVGCKSASGTSSAART